MASPVVEQVVESADTTAVTSHPVNLPTATSGQLLLIIMAKGSTAATINALGDVTELLDENVATGLYVAVRQMDGTEPTSYTFTSSAATRCATMAYRISGAENPGTTAPQLGTTATGTSTTPDPPASATPPSSKDYLFIACYSRALEEADDDTWSGASPTNYSPSTPRQKAGGIGGNNIAGILAACERALTTGSAENPGAFGAGVSAGWRAQTITVHPGIASQGLTGAVFSRAGTFATGVLSTIRALTGTTFASAPSFATGAISGTGPQSLTGSVFARAGTFPTGALTSVRALSGTPFSRAPTFGAGAVSSVRNLGGAVFARAGTFPTGSLTSVRNLAGAPFSRAPTFPAGAISTTRALAGTTFAKAPSFGSGVVSISGGPTTLVGATFVRSPTFGAGVVGRGPVALAGAVFSRSPSFPASSLTSVRGLVGATFVRSPTFAVGSLSTGPLALVGIVFARAPTFPPGFFGAGEIGAAVVVPGTIRRVAPSGTVPAEGGRGTIRRTEP
ncbi:MAG TPA: hypothetical protein VFT76_00225 [Actinomycetota bacterium]|nr:hypothetical protein [Actinomycetota bacterium]